MNLKIRKIKKESSSGISTKPKEKKQNIKLKVIKNVKPEKTERIYKTEVNADAKFGMNDILVFFYEKYDGDWDSIYKAIRQKERVNYSEANQFLKKYKDKYDYVTLIDNDYPEEYKGNYKPPFVLRKRKKK
jgi:predicted Rossmann fold nucleotide-binding protein DprA/Smf involved in DNA uptake